MFYFQKVKQNHAQEWPCFFTATIQQWKHLLKEDHYKNIIVNALKFLVGEEKVTINGFVPIAIGMSNNLHIIWQSKGINEIQKIQNSFIKHTSKEFKKQLEKENKPEEYEVNSVDRKYNFWQRDSLNSHPSKSIKSLFLLSLSTYCAQNICRIFAKREKSLQIYRCLPPKNTLLS